MATSFNDIQKGMDVYGSDGEKIGTVHQVFPGGMANSWTDTSSETWSGGGPGTLGDESRTHGDTGTSGGPGTLGTESRVYSGTSQGGGPGTLGDESRTATEYGATSGDVDTASGTGISGASDPRASASSGTDISGTTGTAGGFSSGTGTSDLGGETTGVIEEDTVIVESVPAGTWSGTGAGPDVGTNTGNGYLDVDHGGFLGIGTQHLYIPFSEVQSVEPGTSVTLSCTKDECINQYQNQPAGIGQNT